MRKSVSMFAFAVLAAFFLAATLQGKEATKSGAPLFAHFCAECHPDGGNLMNARKTLRKEDREANGIKNADDIVNKMRNRGAFAVHPESRVTMKRFSEDTIPDEDARAIARYILDTFN